MSHYMTTENTEYTENLKEDVSGLLQNLGISSYSCRLTTKISHYLTTEHTEYTENLKDYVSGFARKFRYLVILW